MRTALTLPSPHGGEAIAVQLEDARSRYASARPAASYRIDRRTPEGFVILARGDDYYPSPFLAPESQAAALELLALAFSPFDPEGGAFDEERAAGPEPLAVFWRDSPATARAYADEVSALVSAAEEAARRRAA